jgi:hypothetical protein
MVLVAGRVALAAPSPVKPVLAPELVAELNGDDQAAAQAAALKLGQAGDTAA